LRDYATVLAMPQLKNLLKNLDLRWFCIRA